MILKNALHFSLEIWGYIFCIISAICIHISKNINIKVNRTLFFLLTTDGLLLFFDSLAWFFRGNLGKTQYYILVVSNFMVFLLGYVLLFVFTRHLKNYIEQKNKSKIYYCSNSLCVMCFCQYFSYNISIYWFLLLFW